MDFHLVPFGFGCSHLDITAQLEILPHDVTTQCYNVMLSLATLLTMQSAMRQSPPYRAQNTFPIACNEGSGRFRKTVHGFESPTSRHAPPFETTTVS